MSTLENARESLRRGDHAAALEAAEAGLATEPSSIELLRIAGRAGVELGAEGAAERLRRVTELAPDDARAWSDLGDALAADGLTAEAGAAFRKALEIDPEDAPALTSAGHVAYATGSKADALEYLEQAAGRSEGTSTAVISLIEMYKAVGKPEQALETARKVAGDRPDDALAALDVGELSLALGAFDAAADAFGRLRAIVEQPEHEVAALHGLTRVELARGEAGRALELARQARTIDTVGRTRGVLAYLEAEVGGDAALQELARDASAPMLAVIEAPPSRAEVEAALDATLADARRDWAGGSGNG